MKVSVIIPVFLIHPLLVYDTKNCIESVLNEPVDFDLEVIVVNDGSPNKNFIKGIKNKFDGSVKFLNNIKNMGFAHTINKGMANSSGDLILLLNNDVKFKKTGWIKRMADEILSGKSDLVSADFGVINRRTWQYVPKNNRELSKENMFTYPVAWCMMMKREIVEKEGLYPVNFGKGYWEDTAYAWILEKKKYKMSCLINLGLVHEEHKTFKMAGFDIAKLYNKNRLIFLDIKSGKEKIILPKIDDYRKEK